MNPLKLLSILTTALLIGISANAQNKYKNFKTAVYTRAYEVQKMEDSKWMESTWETISSQLKVDKIYLESHRDLLIVDEKTFKKAKKYFEDQGLEVATGITLTIDESNNFQTFCYSKAADREKVQEIVEYSASLFDEIILDDFFFTSCKCNVCIEKKGDRGWADYRLELMTDAAKNLIIGPAKSVNPKVKVVIKYPNWYDHFHELGFNLETQPALFDGVHTGTETRDAINSNQHLQPYLGYLAFRYFSNLKPKGNGGGWVDIYGSKNFDRYAEQLWLTILAKAPEMTLFDYRGILTPLSQHLIPIWSSEESSFDYESFLPIEANETMAKAAGHALTIIDKVAGYLGEPYGIKSYKPYHSSGEDFLENYFGTMGIPLDLVPEFPLEDDLIILTEHAKKDPDIVQKIEQRLIKGKDVVITSGLLNALQDRGIKKIVNLEYTSRKANVRNFLIGRKPLEGDHSMIIPQLQYYTNDSWELISAMDEELGWPFLHRADYGEGILYVWTIPENFTDLYNLPVQVLNRLRDIFCEQLGITLHGASKTSIFLYDNNTIVVESFNDVDVEVEIVFAEKRESLTDLMSKENVVEKIIPKVKFRGRIFTPEKYSYSITIPKHSFRAFKID